MKTTTTRRQFLKNSTATLAGSALAVGNLSMPALARGLDLNERIRVGFIGVGNRGTQLLHGFLGQKDAEVAALCDVYEPYLQRKPDAVDPRMRESLGSAVIPKMGETLGEGVARYRDFRRLLDQKDLDAVVIATPDHWHALQTVMALDAGKDVYVEKPLSLTIGEGRRMVEAARRTGRVVQVGLHRRSSQVYREIHRQIQAGAIGDVLLARAYRNSDMAPGGIGVYPEASVPEGLDWEAWLGPRPQRAFRYSVAPYKFRWWRDYSSQMGNWGVHYCDAVRWLLDEEAPVAVTAHGSQRGVRDDRTVPVTMLVTFEFASGRLMQFGQFEGCDSAVLPKGEMELCGTLGSLYPGVEGQGCVVQRARPGQFAAASNGAMPLEIKAMDGDLTIQHIRNFLDCVRSRRVCACDMETGHRSTTFAHLANLALDFRCRLEWDAGAERIKNHREANARLQYVYREPWRSLWRRHGGWS